MREEVIRANNANEECQGCPPGLSRRRPMAAAACGWGADGRGGVDEAGRGRSLGDLLAIGLEELHANVRETLQSIPTALTAGNVAAGCSVVSLYSSAASNRCGNIEYTGARLT